MKDCILISGMRSITIFLFCFLVQPALAQYELSGIIINQTTRQPVPYATIRSVQTGVVVDSDEKGVFRITAFKQDTLVIRCIGYKEKRILSDSRTGGDTIYMEENPVMLDEVFVGRSETRIFGILNKKFGSSRVGGSSAERSEIVTLIEIPDSARLFRINKVFIKARRFDRDNPIRLRIYSINADGLPGEELLKESVIISKNNFDRKKQVILVDVQKQNILLRGESFFVGIQWITEKRVKWPTGPEIIQTTQVSKILSYYRDANQTCNECWYANNFQSIIFYPEGKKPGIGGPMKGNPLNACAAAEIEFYAN